MQNYLLVDNIEKPHDQVLRNYDFNETIVSGGAGSGVRSASADKGSTNTSTPRASQTSNRHLYTNLFDWKTLNDKCGNENAAQDCENHDSNDENIGKKTNQEQKQPASPSSEDNQGKIFI